MVASARSIFYIKLDFSNTNSKLIFRDNFMEKKEVVTAFLLSEGKVLLLRRSQSVSSYQGKWAGVSGYLEKEPPLEQALTEIREETSLSGEDITFLTAGLPLTVEDPNIGVCWMVHPFLFRVENPAGLRLDREHTESRWFDSEEIPGLPTVPRLFEVLRRVLP
jgi:8-oxo-dGTP diphosphatase